MLPDFRVRQRDYLLEISRALTQELDLESARHNQVAIGGPDDIAGLVASPEGHPIIQ